MRLSFLIVFSIAYILSGCRNNDKTNVVLKQQPFASLTDSINKMSGNSELYYKRGVLLFENNQPFYARVDIEKAWNLVPKEEYALSLARLLQQKNSDSAVIFLQSALKKIPNSIALQVSLAKGYQSKNNPEKALAISNEIIKEYPGQLDALLLKAEILQAQNKQPEALATLEQAYQYAPFDVELVHNLAFQYAESKNKKTLPLADSLITADARGTHAEPYLFKGIYYYNLKNYNAALSAFNQAIIKDYNYLDAHMYKGQVFYDQKLYAQALKAFSLVTNITPTYADAYYWIGKTGEALGDKKEAKLNYERAYQLDKEFSEAKEAANRLK
jgi:tetratricopeptide (TPR) repeat protein